MVSKSKSADDPGTLGKADLTENSLQPSRLDHEIKRTNAGYEQILAKNVG